MKNIKLILVSIGIVISLILLVTVFANSFTNKAIIMEEQILTANSNLDVQYKKRLDLVGNLVDIVEEYSEYEAETLRAIIEERSNSTDIENVTTSISVISEQYPELKANENYKHLMNELTIIENTIVAYRNDYNNEVRAYNKFIRTFPNKQMLSLMGYESFSYTYLNFEDATEDAPTNLFGRDK